MSEEEGETWQCFGDWKIIPAVLFWFFFFFWVCLTGTLGFQQEESYSNWFLREQKHRSEFWLRQQKDNGEWYGFCGTLGMLLCKCSRPAAWKMMFDLEWHGGCKQVEKKKYRLDWSALKEGEKKGLETSQRCSSQIWVKAWGRSVYSLTCYAYCQGFLPC